MDHTSPADHTSSTDPASPTDFRSLAREFFQAACARPAPMSSRFDGVNRGEIATLSYLRARGDMTPSEISGCKGISTARVANILASLEKKGLVKRIQDTRDRRKIIVRITEAGARLADQKYEELLDDLEQMMRGLGEKDAREFLRLTRQANAVLAVNHTKGASSNA